VETLENTAYIRFVSDNQENTAATGFSMNFIASEDGEELLLLKIKSS